MEVGEGHQQQRVLVGIKAQAGHHQQAPYIPVRLQTREISLSIMASLSNNVSACWGKQMILRRLTTFYLPQRATLGIRLDGYRVRMEQINCI